MTVVRVYTKPSCGPCVATKRALGSKGIPFVEEDATDPQNMAAIKALGFMSAPVVVAGEDMWSGFQIGRINELAERTKDSEERK